MPGLRAIAIPIALAIGCGTPDRGTATSALAGDAAVDPGTIAIAPTTIDIVGPAGQQATAAFAVSGLGLADQLVEIAWLDDGDQVLSSLSPPCAAGSCSVSPAIDLPFAAGSVACTPAATTRTAHVQLTSNSGAVATATVNCRTVTSGPGFAMPEIVGPLLVQVGTSDADSLRVTNTGSQTLAISAQLDAVDPDSAAWQIGRCSAPATCALDAGATLDIPLTLRPDRHGSFDTSVSVTGPPAVGTLFATVLGTGLGGALRVDQPPSPFVVDFGTIAKGQTVAIPVAMTDVGNQDITVTPSDPGAPFAVSTAAVALARNGGTGGFDVECSSATALAQTTSTIDLALSPNTYTKDTDELTVRCEIANTTIAVTNPLDFGELRHGDPEGQLAVAIFNPPGGGDATVERIELIGAPAGLTVVAPALPATVADADQLDADLHLATDADVTLADVVLEVEVVENATTSTLRVPVSGKVGTPNAVVLPTELDLGTVCVGTLAAGQVTLTNTGTSTLRLDRPAIDTSFLPVFVDPVDYPAAGAVVLPTAKAVVGVQPATPDPGKLAGTLHWQVDVEDLVFDVPITLEQLAEGTAVSPARLVFGTAAITDPPLQQQTISLENCGPDVAMMSYGRPNAITGKAESWQVDPPSQSRSLLPGERTKIRVAFAPTEPGRQEAVLAIAIDGRDTVVRFEGDATGTLPDKTTFYACDCSGSGGPQRGWPIALAILVAVRRRRR